MSSYFLRIDYEDLRERSNFESYDRKSQKVYYRICRIMHSRQTPLELATGLNYR